MQKARRHCTKQLRPIVSTRFQVLFTPLFGVLFIFPSRYWSTIGLSGVFSLGGWCRQIPTGFLRSRGTQDTTSAAPLTCTGLSPVSPGFPSGSTSLGGSHNVVLQPRICRNIHGLGSFPFARHYLGNHCYFLLLRLLRCFSSARSLPALPDAIPSVWQVAPFGNPRIGSHLPIPAAYRSLSRPSSPLRA